eukprot:scaffold99593_cov32-Tisochrysis_lutea.AAC.2
MTWKAPEAESHAVQRVGASVRCSKRSASPAAPTSRGALLLAIHGARRRKGSKQLKPPPSATSPRTRVYSGILARGPAGSELLSNRANRLLFPASGTRAACRRCASVHSCAVMGSSSLCTLAARRAAVCGRNGVAAAARQWSVLPRKRRS